MPETLIDRVLRVAVPVLLVVTALFIGAMFATALGRQPQPRLHDRRICVPGSPCTTVGIPAGGCATVHGVTVCVGPDAGVPTPEVSP